MTMDDLTRARAKRIAATRTTDEINASIREFRNACPACGIPLNQHDRDALNNCALACESTPFPEGA